MNRVGVKQNQTAKEAARRAYRFSWSRLPGVVRYAVLLGALVTLWQLYVTIVDPPGLPGPPEVAGAFVGGWMRGYLAAATWKTLGVLAVGMFVGMALAVPLAIFANRTKVGDDLLALLVLTLDAIPAVAILPLLLLWSGATLPSLVLVAAYAVAWPVATNLRSGLNSVEPTIILVGQNLGLRGWGIVRYVLLPSALPHVLSGARTGWACGWRAIVAAGLVLSVTGENPGFFTDGAGGLLETPELLAALLNLALVGILVEAGFSLLERFTIIRWGTKTRA